MKPTTRPKIAIALGTRPEIIKCAPVIRETRRRDYQLTLVHTGQHYSQGLDDVFFDQLELPTPDYNLEVGSKPHGQQTGEMVAGLEEILLEENLEVLLVQGDTNSVLAGAIAASKLDVDLGHIEAGLRSFDREMPEETNRVLTDHVADYLFPPTEQAATHLKNENLSTDRIHMTGNTIVDAVQQNMKIAQENSDILNELDLEAGQYALVTAHRAENVDNVSRFSDIIDGIHSVAKEQDLDVVYPIHPRAREKLAEIDIEIPDVITVVDPLNYLDFLRLESEAAIVLTDSGGVQEETSILDVPCVTMRDNTERPETLEIGANKLVGTEPDDIRKGVSEMIDRDSTWETPYGGGDAAERILDIICRDHCS